MARTAKDLKKEEISAYHPWQAVESFRNDPYTMKRKERAWKVARAAADMLRRRYGARRVVAFGSVVCETGFTPWSDVDLAAWGLPQEVYYDAAGTAMDLGLEEGIKVDVVDMERCPPALREEVDHEGVEL